jgi:hypothetical protein
MKKLLGIAFLSLFLAASSVASAQEQDSKVKTGAKKTGQAVKKGGKAVGKTAKKGAKTVGQGAAKVGQNTAEVASKGKSKITDKEIKSKQGPNGETIYQDDRGYYWVDERGRKTYMRYGSLKDRI